MATGDEVSSHAGMIANVRRVPCRFEPDGQDPFWHGLNGPRTPQAVDLDWLGINSTCAQPEVFDGGPVVLRLQNEEIAAVENGMCDCVEAPLHSLDEPETRDSVSLLSRVATDHRNYYSLDTALVVGMGAGVAATFAHTYVDEEIYFRVHRSVVYGDGHDWAVPLHATKLLGEGTITLPVFAGFWLTSALLDEIPLLDTAGEWGERSLRAFLVGAPPLLAMQYLTGASRPEESEFGSAWHPLQDTNGASGHAFMGALPLLTAAEMVEWWPGKIALVVVSFFPGLSRVADDDHYVSQALLGWTMAYVAASAVDRTEHPDRHLKIFPLIAGDQIGAGLEYRW